MSEHQDYVRNPADPQGPMITREHAAQIGSSMLSATARVASGEPVPVFEPKVSPDKESGEADSATGLIDFVPGITDAEVDSSGLQPPPEHLRVPDHKKWVPPTR